MPCYHPLFGFYEGKHTPSGAKKYRITACPDDPIFALEAFPGSVIIPCGKCVGCRIQYSRTWADRMILELMSAQKGLFVTLTYNNDHVPIVEDDDGVFYGFSLRKKDVSDFMKRLRSRQRFENKTIRFFSAGEYGPTTLRPHYHAILFGLNLEDFPDRQSHGVNELGQVYYVSKELEEIWQNGYCLISEVSWRTCAYVARYVMKKIGSELKDFHEDFEKEFTLMSRRPGIGKPFLDEHPDCLQHETIFVGDKREANEIPVPRYFKETLKLTDKEMYDKLKAQRQKYASDKMILQLANTSLSYLDKLEQDENSFLSKIKPLKRNKV